MSSKTSRQTAEYPFPTSYSTEVHLYESGATLTPREAQLAERIGQEYPPWTVKEAIEVQCRQRALGEARPMARDLAVQVQPRVLRAAGTAPQADLRVSCEVQPSQRTMSAMGQPFGALPVVVEMEALYESAWNIADDIAGSLRRS